MPSPDLASALMGLSEQLAPIVEFADGQKNALLDREWSDESAEQYALAVLLECVHIIFNKQKETPVA